MIQLTPKHKLFVALEPLDFRCGIDAIAARCQQQLQLDPMSGHYFIFRNRSARAIKLLVYDEQGFWLAHKRLSKGRFKHWPQSQQTVMVLEPPELQVLLYNGDPSLVSSAPVWRRIT